MTRWEHEAVVDRARARLERSADMMRRRRATVEHPFGTLKAWMGSTHFLTKTGQLMQPVQVTGGRW